MGAAGSSHSVGGGLALIGLTTLLLVLEFLSGMWVNLYDSSLPGSYGAILQPSGALSALWLHLVFGVLVGLLAVATLVWSAVRHRPRVLSWSLLGLIGVVVAAAGGSRFLITQSPGDSFLMAIGFLLAFAAYARAAGVLARHRWGPGAAPYVTGPPPTASPPAP